MKIPFVDLRAQYQSIRQEIDEAVSDVIENARFIGGDHVSNFEKEFAAALGVKYCISAGNGTDTLYIIMRMLGIGPGDEVITPANSWISSSETITQTGARAVFVDVDPKYYSIDETRIEEKITERTKAIMAVHLQGQACNLDAITGICRSRNLLLIEDCAQSHLSQYKNRLVGTFGKASSFSFFPGKNLGAYGDAGCILTDDDQAAEKFRMYARHGALVKHQHRIEGINSRLDSLHAAVLRKKLRHLKDWNAQRNVAAASYDEGLKGISEITIPAVRPETFHTYHLYVVLAERRDELSVYLQQQGIETLIHYPTPLPFLEAYRYMGHKPEDFPVAHALQKKILSLPMFPEITPEQVAYIVNAIKKFYSQ